MNPELYCTNDKTWFDIPQHYREQAEDAKPGTPVSGYDERKINVYSRDKMACKCMNLALLEGQVYIKTDAQGKVLYGYPLPDKLNQYLKDTIFAE